MITSARFQRMVSLAIVFAFAVVFYWSGAAEWSREWLQSKPSVTAFIRCALILTLVGGGIAWLLDPDRKLNGQPKARSRLWVILAFALAALQILALFIGPDNLTAFVSE